MPSSTSGSKSSRYRLKPDRFTLVLLATIAVILASLEFVSRERFDSVSKVQRREVSERKALLAVRDTGANQDPHVAMVGNSLMLEGTNLPLLRARLNPRYLPVPYFVLGTNYYDWLYGLTRLFAEGMRPEYVVVGLSPNQLASSEVRGDISARYLIQQSDLLDIVRQTHMDATRASEFILAHYSEYYSTREITRGYIMSRVLPSVGQLLHIRYASARDPKIDEAVLKALAINRLVALNQLCQANGARLIFVVPPTYQKGAETIAIAGKEKRVTVLVPVDDDQLDGGSYQEDGIHLNHKGAEIFTAKLAESLNRALPE
jgi:lysophospholipase L1-like esterase